jgi:hypothetical protein
VEGGRKRERWWWMDGCEFDTPCFLSLDIWLRLGCVLSMCGRIWILVNR